MVLFYARCWKYHHVISFKVVDWSNKFSQSVRALNDYFTRVHRRIHLSWFVKHIMTMHINFVICIFLWQLLTNRLFVRSCYNYINVLAIDILIIRLLTKKQHAYLYIYLCTSLYHLNVNLEITSNDLCDGVNAMEIRIYLLVDSCQHRLWIISLPLVLLPWSIMVDNRKYGMWDHWINKNINTKSGIEFVMIPDIVVNLHQ